MVRSSFPGTIESTDDVCMGAPIELAMHQGPASSAWIQLSQPAIDDIICSARNIPAVTRGVHSVVEGSSCTKLCNRCKLVKTVDSFCRYD
jgi:hypothetical protein